MTEAPPLWRVSVSVPQSAVPAIEMVLEGACSAVSSLGDDGEMWTVDGYTDSPPDEQGLAEGLALAASGLGIPTPSMDIEFLTPRDWLAENLADFPPLFLGRFFVHPSHYEGSIPASMIPFQIDAATAFGSGTHPTTRTCLRAMEDIARFHPATRVLDLGCGSGLLGFAAAHLWPARVLGVDIDPEAVRVAARNARINRCPHRVQVALSTGYGSEAVRRHAPFDVIVANVLARPLNSMAGDTARHVQRGGFIILSGLLIQDRQWVSAHHRARGLVLHRVYRDDGWATLVFKRP